MPAHRRTPGARSFGVFAEHFQRSLGPLARCVVVISVGLWPSVLRGDGDPFPGQGTTTQVLPQDRSAMREVTGRFAPSTEAPGVPVKYFARYGGTGKPPTTWGEMNDELIARAKQRNLSMLCQLPVIACRDPDPAGGSKAAELFLECARQFIAGGDTEAGGTTYMVERTKVGPNTLAMRDVMQEAGIYDEFVRVWMMERFMAAEDPGLNMDWARSRLPLSWALVANMADGVEKLHRLRRLQRASDHAIRKLFTLDGGGIHHSCDHLAYASYSAPKIIALAQRLHGSDFALADDTVDRLRAFARAHAFMTVDGHVPGNLMTRAAVGPVRFPQLPTILSALAKLPAGGAEGRVSAPLDPATLTGHLSYNVSAAALHRRDSWLVAIDGARNDMRGVEIYDYPGRGSSFMRNSCFGSVQILEAGKPHGYARPGWNFNHFAGVASRLLPPEELASGRRPSYIRNGSAFAGGASLGPDGVWGMIVADGNVPCRKSAFCFDNRVTLLTSGIQVRTGTRPVVTTLFQSAFVPADEPLPEQKRLPLDKAATVTDPQGNGYFVHPAAGQRLSILRRHQTWPVLDELAESAPDDVRKLLGKKRLTVEERRRLIEHNASPGGHFALAYVEHSAESAVATCAFTIFVQQPDVPDALPYEILRQDDHAHILRDQPSRTTAWVLFEAGRLAGGPLVEAVSRPCFVICREAADGGLALSVAATDTGNSDPVTLELTGLWELRDAVVAASPACTSSGNSTTVRVDIANYLPVRFHLVRRTL